MLISFITVYIISDYSIPTFSAVRISKRIVPGKNSKGIEINKVLNGLSHIELEEINDFKF